MTFEDLAHELGALGVLLSPSEVHGMFCGRLVMGELLAGQKLLSVAEEFLETEAFDEIAELIEELYQFCAGQIQQTGLEFTPLLPEDFNPISYRTEALAQWCQGFLHGLSQAGLSKNLKFSDDAKETLEDLAAISQLKGEDADSDDEVNFFELVEFVRVVVLVLHMELGQPETTRPTLH